MNLKEYNINLASARFDGLKDALAQMMEAKRVNPGLIIYLYPGAEKSAEWDERNLWVSTTPLYTNLPEICPSEGSETPMDILLRKISNERGYVSEMAAFIADKYNVEETEPWEFAVITADPGNGIELFFDSSAADEVMAIVDGYNSQADDNGYGALTVDKGAAVVAGQYADRAVAGGFFEKRKIRKQNEEQRQQLYDCLDSLTPFLRRI